MAAHLKLGLRNAVLAHVAVHVEGDAGNQVDAVRHEQHCVLELCHDLSCKRRETDAS